MNVHVHTAEGIATICGDVIYDFNDQIVEPSPHHASLRAAGHRQSRRVERMKKAAINKRLSSSRFLLPGDHRPTKMRAIGWRRDYRILCRAGSRSRCRGGTGSWPDRKGAMTHTAIRKDFEDLVDQYGPVGQAGTGLHLHRRPHLTSARSLSSVL